MYKCVEKPKTFRTHRGEEYMNKKIITVGYIPEQNEVGNGKYVTHRNG